MYNTMYMYVNIYIYTRMYIDIYIYTHTYMISVNINHLLMFHLLMQHYPNEKDLAQQGLQYLKVVSPHLIHTGHGKCPKKI